MGLPVQLAYFLAIALWALDIPLVVASLGRIVRKRSLYVRNHLVRSRNDPHIIFQITTRSATESRVVRRGIESIRTSCAEASYADYSLSVVTDDPSDVPILPEGVLPLPSSYRTSNGASRKARALQYAVEARRAEGRNGSEYWVYHLDEESVVMPQTVLSLLQFIREQKALIGEGPIFYSIKIAEASKLCLLTESLRPFYCYDCLSQMANPPPLHIHGSNLLVRADIEDTVGWDFPDAVAEDQLFGLKTYDRYGRVFGWHGGVLLEQPPFTLRDHFRQRRRWATGVLQNLKKISTKVKTKVYLGIAVRLATYWVGFVAGLAVVSFYGYYLLQHVFRFFENTLTTYQATAELSSLPIPTPESVLKLLQRGSEITFSWEALLPLVLGSALLVAYVAWAFSYQVGLHWNLKYTGLNRLEKMSLHLQQLILFPIVGAIEVFPVFFTLTEYYLLGRMNRDFPVISK